MITGGGGYRWIRLPLASSAKNFSRRTGKFKLLEDGTLEASIRVEHNGHQAISRRTDLFTKTPAEREELLKNSWKETHAAAEISGFMMDDFNDGSKPYNYSFTPGAVNETTGLAGLNIKIELNKETNVLKYSRRFSFGANGRIIFDAGAYKPLKFLFDSIHKADTHVISLKQK